MNCINRIGIAAALALGAVMLNGSPYARAAEPQGAPSFSSDPQVAVLQHQVYDVVHRYETMLNTGDTAGIMAMFAPDSVAEWNNRPTFATAQERKAAYDALFKDAKFSTVFGYASVEADGETGVVRTFHHKGAAVVEGGKEVVDLNREVFVLRKFGSEWKIVLYIFNTDPVQGEG